MSLNLFEEIPDTQLRLGVDAAKILAGEMIRENPVLATVILAGADLGQDELHRRFVASLEAEEHLKS